MKGFVLSVILIIYCSNLLAQTSGLIRTSRPGQSFTPFTVGKSVFQLQSGININGFDSGARTDGSGGLLAVLGRYGITETVEIRTEFQFSYNKVSQGDTEETMDGLSASIVGVRFNINDPENVRIPAFGFQVDLNLNIASSSYQSDHIAPRFILLHTQALSNRLGLSSNWGVAWNGNDASPRGFYTVAFTYALGESWSLLLENYGEVEDSDFDTRFDTGVGYLMNDNLQLDIGLGYGKNDGLTDYFVDTGISVRL
jgi:hypothetical protein